MADYDDNDEDLRISPEELQRLEEQRNIQRQRDIQHELLLRAQERARVQAEIRQEYAEEQRRRQQQPQPQQPQAYQPRQPIMNPVVGARPQAAPTRIPALIFQNPRQPGYPVHRANQPIPPEFSRQQPINPYAQPYPLPNPSTQVFTQPVAMAPPPIPPQPVVQPVAQPRAVRRQRGRYPAPFTAMSDEEILAAIVVAESNATSKTGVQRADENNRKYLKRLTDNKSSRNCKQTVRDTRRPMENNLIESKRRRIDDEEEDDDDEEKDDEEKAKTDGRRNKPPKKKPNTARSDANLQNPTFVPNDDPQNIDPPTAPIQQPRNQNPRISPLRQSPNYLQPADTRTANHTGPSLDDYLALSHTAEVQSQRLADAQTMIGQLLANNERLEAAAHTLHQIGENLGIPSGESIYDPNTGIFHENFARIRRGRKQDDVEEEEGEGEDYAEGEYATDDDGDDDDEEGEEDDEVDHAAAGQHPYHGADTDIEPPSPRQISAQTFVDDSDISDPEFPDSSWDD